MPGWPSYDPPNVDERGALNRVEALFFTVATVIATAFGIGQAGGSAIIQAVINRVRRAYPNIPIPPATLAAAVVKGAVDFGDATDEAIRSGLSPERFDVEVRVTGNPPGPMELLDQWRRGLITQASFEHGLRSGYLRDEWIPFYEALRHEPLSAREYVQAAVEGHLSVADMTAKVDGLGVDGFDAQLLFDTAGSPPGVEQMIHLWHRGLLTRDQLVQGIKESHYKNKYIDALIAGGEYLPPPRTITTLLTHGAITDNQARAYFVAAGLAPDLADAYIASAQHVKTASHKELAVGTVKSLYADRVITRESAITDLAKVGYAGPEANLILDLADAQAKQKVTNATVAKVRTLFVSHRIDGPTVLADLGKLGMDPPHVADLVDLWTLERGTPTRQLSVGQLNQAYKKGIIDEATFVARAQQLGYTPADAAILAAIDVPPSAP